MVEALFLLGAKLAVCRAGDWGPALLAETSKLRGHKSGMQSCWWPSCSGQLPENYLRQLLFPAVSRPRVYADQARKYDNYDSCQNIVVAHDITVMPTSLVTQK
jgi:hypothetical protein